MTSITADELTRNDRVKLADDEIAYLVDSVTDLPDGRVQVVFSSGDVAEYAPNAEISIID
jgi:hypothetical protein